MLFAGAVYATIMSVSVPTNPCNENIELLKRCEILINQCNI